MSIVIIDYGMGNLRSIQKKIAQFSKNQIVSNDPKEIENSEKLILPGVGQFGVAVKNLKLNNILDLLNYKVLEQQTPILGICLGMQLMAKSSEEGYEYGLGWFNAEVVKFDIKNKLKYKVPHIGWNDVIIKKDNPLFKNIDMGRKFYFVHSYHIKCQNAEDTLTETEYEFPFVSAIWKNNIFGVQFHPEKSHEQGDILLKNFIEI